MLAPDGKMRLIDVADTEQVLRLVQSIPSKKQNRSNGCAGFKIVDFELLIVF